MGNKNVMVTKQQSLSNANVFESTILGQPNRERKLKNFLVFGVRKSLNMSNDDQAGKKSSNSENFLATQLSSIKFF